MFFDTQFGGFTDAGFLTYPDFVFAANPLPISEISDQENIQGDLGNSNSIEGSLDPG